MQRKKLYELSNSSFAIPYLIGKDRSAITTNAENIPMLAWPDGSWCLPANVYMLELYWRGLSRKDRGGTLLSYATNISHLIRFCHDNRVEFINLSDNEFSLFIRGLHGEKRKNAPDVPVRNANTVIAIGRNCLEFLSSVARLNADSHFIGPTGRVRAEEREYEIKEGNFRRKTGTVVSRYWHHRSFPPPDPKKRRLPVTDENLNRLRAAIVDCSHSIFVRKRRYIMLDLMDSTGARRFELAHLRVASVAAALRSAPHLLKLVTAKKRGREEYRFLPLSLYHLQRLDEYIDKNRAPIIRATCGSAADDGYVFISETTGRQLRPNTFTQEIAAIRKAAGIEDQLSPQMFRHRFITKLFVSLIEIHNCKTEDDFRRAILDTETMKQKVQQWTGTGLASLDNYIHLAFSEVANFQETTDIIGVERLIDSFEADLDQVVVELNTGDSVAHAAMDLRRMISAIRADLKHMREPVRHNTKE